MKEFLAMIVAALIVLASPSSFACSVIPISAEQKFEGGDSVVLAVPIAISNLPKEGGNPRFRGEFRQTILWQVMVTWKGKYRPGDQFTTREKIDKGGMCSDGWGQYDRQARLLYLSGKEPFADFVSLSPEQAMDDFRFLQSFRSKNGT